MDFFKELNEMRQKYTKKPPKNEKLPRPEWLTPEDGLYSVYEEKEQLFHKGQIYYGYIVQANIGLFSFFPHSDLPANIIYSTEEVIARDPMLMKRMGQYLFHFKKEQEHSNSEYKEILNVIRDELDRSSFKFKPLRAEELGEEMYFTSIMVFRKHLPCRVLKGGIVPIIAAPDKCRSVMILPKKYWTKNFKRAWLTHFGDT